MKNILFAFAALALVVGCQSKKKVDEAQDVTSTTPTVDSTPMSFDPAGSDSGKIDGLVTVHFEYDKATLSSETKAQLATNAQWIKANPKVKIQVEGHCDNRGTIEYNLALGERRAQSVKSYLQGLGVAADQLTIISYGEEKPMMTGDSEQAWSKNRRANFLPTTM